jgi:hypothetical protein
MNNWTTKVPTESSARRRKEFHLAMFEPERWRDDRAQVSLDIPVWKLTLCWVVDGIPRVAYVPTNTTSFRTAVRRACKEAIERQALLWFSCDTARQANLAARLAARWLPNHRRQALERMDDAESRERSKLH